jgi:glycosyltransferase involved in cell wall biosynthesis
MTMRIRVVARSLDIGGAERQLVELARGLHARGHAVSVTLFYGAGALEVDLHAAGVPVQILDKRGRWDVMRFLPRLAVALRMERPDILYSFLPVPNVLSALVKPAVPGTRLVWAIRASDRNKVPLDWPSRVAYGLEATLAPLADLILPNSRAGFVHGQARGISKDKMLVVPNGIDTERFRPSLPGRARVRAELGLAADELAVGIVARLDPIKDHGTFLAAAAMLAAARRERLRFVVVGDGPPKYRAELEAQSRRIGLAGVTWAGGRSDMPDVYSALDLVCSSSLSEGFPNCVAEAMSCERACAVTDAGDSATIVDGTGVVVPPASPAALAAGLGTLLDRLAIEGPASVGAAARARIVQSFGREALITRTAEIFAELLDRAPAIARRAS